MSAPRSPAQRQSRPVPAHQDPRLSGLIGPPPKRGRFGRRKPTVPDVEVSAGELEAIRAPLPAPRRIGVVGLKGGVGKTTLSVLLSGTLARERPEPILLVDADTTYGSFLLRTGVTPVACSADLAAMGDPGRMDVLTAAMSRTRDGYWVLPSGRNPAQSAAFGEATYVAAMKVVYRHFPLMVTDCGAGLASPLMYRVLAGCHSLVVATTPSLDGILATHNALQWLTTAGFEGLARRTVVVLTGVRRDSGFDVAETRSRLAPLCRSVAVLPYDEHLALGGYLDDNSLAAATREAATGIGALAMHAALVVD